MASAARHMARIRRSHQATKATLGTFAQRNYTSSSSKAIYQGMFLKLLTKMSTRLQALSARLSERFSQNFRKQDRA